MPELPSWPTEHVDLDDVLNWIGTTASPVVLHTKTWGMTARFGDVIFKAAYPPLFPHADAAYRLLADVAPQAHIARWLTSTTRPGQAWTLFEAIDGVWAEHAGPQHLARIAAACASVQAATVGARPGVLPVTLATDIVDRLLDDLRAHAPQLEAPLSPAAPLLREIAQELASSDVPLTIDHTDLHDGNAIVASDGRLVLIDWEEAVFSVPYFSLDRLREDAKKHGREQEVIDAYLDAAPWGDPHVLELAAVLGPLKFANESRAFARNLGWDYLHDELVSVMIEISLGRLADIRSR